MKPHNFIAFDFVHVVYFVDSLETFDEAIRLAVLFLRPS
jgi:hypothetical protein